MRVSNGGPQGVSSEEGKKTFRETVKKPSVSLKA